MPDPMRPTPFSSCRRGLGAALASLLLLAACGMKGPLYMPEPPPPTDEELAQPPAIPEGSNPTTMPLS